MSKLMVQINHYFIIRKRLIFLLRFFLLVIIVLLLILFYTIHKTNHESIQFNDQNVDNLYLNEMFVIAITICGNQSLFQGMVALKSAVLFSQTSKLHMIIMTDDHLMDNIRERLDSMNVYNNLSYELYSIQYPHAKDWKVWRKLFKECASQRLFLPAIIDPKYDSILYIDTDVLLLSSIEEIWSFFSEMNSSQLAGMAFESEDFSSNWYHRFARHPFYKPYGLNSGVMLMNLTRMRQFKWVEKLEPILQEYQMKIVWGDQDIINIIFNSFPEKLYLFDCNWNYRPDHCIYSLNCKQAKSNGIKLLHGNRGSFITEKQPLFKAIFDSFRKFDLNINHKTDLKMMIQSFLPNNTNHSNCDKAIDYVFKSIVE